MPLLKTEFKDQILTVLLSDEASRNAFSPAMAAELYAALQKPNLRGLVVSHNFSYFCSGGNLKFYKSLKTKEEGLAHNQEISRILSFLDSLAVPKACFVNGTCLGGGIEVLSCFDYVIASPESLFGLWQRRVGLTYGWGGQERLARRISKRQLANWLLSAQTKNAYAAQDLGLVDQVSLSGAGVSMARHWVERCLDLGLDSLACILDPEVQEASAFSKLWLGESHMKALKKFK